MRDAFDQQHLQGLGFTGFLELRHLDRRDPRVPSAAGIYVVVLDGSGSFREQSVGGWFKGRNPTVPASALVAKWCEATQTQYVGRANDLRRRVAQLARFGRGEPVGHYGGRYLWQLQDSDRLRVAWREVEDPISAETELLDEFESVMGQLPFANLVRGTRQPALGVPS